MNLMLDHIFPGKPEENKELITDGTHDRGIDAVYITTSDGNNVVNLFSFLY